MSYSDQSTPNLDAIRLLERFPQRQSTLLTRWRLAFLRGIIWSLIGLIYAPLFTGLVELMDGLGWGHATYVAAAALAGAVGAALYGSREIALVSTGLGVVVGVSLLIGLSEQVSAVSAILLAAVVGAVVGLTVPFSSRCSRNIPAKVLAGLVSGAVGGGILAIAEPLHPAPFSIFAILAFLASVNGVLYVATVRWWVDLGRRVGLDSRYCTLTEALVMATLAGVAAGSVWMISGPLLTFDIALWQEASVAMHQNILQAILGGLFGGGTAGILLEVFRFSWVHDL